MKLSTKDVIYIGLLSAICIVATFILFPLPTGGMTHLGSAALFTIAAAFGGMYAGLAGAIGSGIFDLISGHTSYTLFSIIIKGLAGMAVGVLTVGMYPSAQNYPIVSRSKILLATIVGAIITAIGYFIAWAIVLDSIAVAATRLPATFITSGVGIIVALLLAPAIQKIAKHVFKK